MYFIYNFCDTFFNILYIIIVCNKKNSLICYKNIIIHKHNLKYYKFIKIFV